MPEGGLPRPKELAMERGMPRPKEHALQLLGIEEELRRRRPPEPAALEVAAAPERGAQHQEIAPVRREKGEGKEKAKAEKEKLREEKRRAKEEKERLREERAKAEKERLREEKAKAEKERLREERLREERERAKEEKERAKEEKKKRKREKEKAKEKAGASLPAYGQQLLMNGDLYQQQLFAPHMMAPWASSWPSWWTRKRPFWTRSARASCSTLAALPC